MSRDMFDVGIIPFVGMKMQELLFLYFGLVGLIFIITRITFYPTSVKRQIINVDAILSNCAIDVLHEIGRADAAGELLRRLREIDGLPVRLTKRQAGAIREIGGALAPGGTGRMIFRMDYVFSMLQNILEPRDFEGIYVKLDPDGNIHHATLNPIGAVPLKDIKKHIHDLTKAWLGAEDLSWKIEKTIRQWKDEYGNAPGGLERILIRKYIKTTGDVEEFSRNMHLLLGLAEISAYQLLLQVVEMLTSHIRSTLTASHGLYATMSGKLQYMDVNLLATFFPDLVMRFLNGEGQSEQRLHDLWVIASALDPLVYWDSGRRKDVLDILIKMNRREGLIALYEEMLRTKWLHHGYVSPWFLDERTVKMPVF